VGEYLMSLKNTVVTPSNLYVEGINKLNSKMENFQKSLSSDTDTKIKLFEDAITTHLSSTSLKLTEDLCV
jgi:hypothetical protein